MKTVVLLILSILLIGCVDCPDDVEASPLLGTWDIQFNRWDCAQDGEPGYWRVVFTITQYDDVVTVAEDYPEGYVNSAGAFLSETEGHVHFEGLYSNDVYDVLVSETGAGPAASVYYEHKGCVVENAEVIFVDHYYPRGNE